MMAIHGVLVLVLCVVGFHIVSSDGDTIQSSLKDYIYMHRAKRGMTPAVRGVLAWRKLVWNSKPVGSRGSAQLKYNGYFKAGDFDNALKDFSSAVPNAVMTHSAKGRIYEGRVGDRMVILRERGAGVEDKLSTIEIVKEQTRDVVFYMGKDWQKDSYMGKDWQKVL